MQSNEEELYELLLVFRQSINNIKDLTNRLDIAEKQTEQLTLLITAVMDTLFIKNTITPTELEQTISKIVNKDKNITIH